MDTLYVLLQVVLDVEDRSSCCSSSEAEVLENRKSGFLLQIDSHMDKKGQGILIRYACSVLTMVGLQHTREF